MNSQTAFRDNVKLIIVRRFSNEAKANICAAFLREEGIRCFISNSNTGTLIPFINGGFLLHIAENDLHEATTLLEQFDIQSNSRVDEDFREADLSDIAYERDISEYEKRITRGDGKYLAWGLVILAIILAFIWAYVRGLKSTSGATGEVLPTVHIPYERL